MPGEGDCDKDRDCERGLVRLNLMWKNNNEITCGLSSKS